MRIIIVMVLLLCGCARSNRSVESEARQSVKCTIAREASYEQREFAALTTADDAVNLAFKISGRIVDIGVAKGKRVKRGEVLARLDEHDVELQVNASKATYTEALQRLERGRRLVEHNAISQQEFESLESSAEQARAAYENSIALLSDTRIVAPFDGVVERTYADAYERVSSGQTIIRLVNPISTTVGFTAPESLLSSLDKESTRFEVIMDKWPDIRFEAKIKSYARTSSDALGFPVSLRLVGVDSNKYQISPGMTCIAVVITPESKSGVITLPLTAIYAPMTGGEYVWVVGEDSRVTKHRVEVKRLTKSDSVEVVGDIANGAKIVVSGVYKLHENQLVRIIE